MNMIIWFGTFWDCVSFLKKPIWMNQTPVSTVLPQTSTSRCWAVSTRTCRALLIVRSSSRTTLLPAKIGKAAGLQTTLAVVDPTRYHHGRGHGWNLRNETTKQVWLFSFTPECETQLKIYIYIYNSINYIYNHIVPCKATHVCSPWHLLVNGTKIAVIFTIPFLPTQLNILQHLPR